MKQNSIWKKVILLGFASVFALHIQAASAQDESGSANSSTGTEECVITEDQM